MPALRILRKENGMYMLPPRPAMAPIMTRTQWLRRTAEPGDMMAALNLHDGYCSTAGTLARLITASSPWMMQLPYCVWVGAYGLLWALETQRVPMDDARAIRRLEARALCQLVADIAAACPRPDDVPLYLAARALGRAA